MSEESERDARIADHEAELFAAKDALGDMQVVVHFRDQGEMETAVVRLLRHGHHFAVVPEMDRSVVVSAGGLDCLYKMQEET